MLLCKTKIANTLQQVKVKLHWCNCNLGTSMSYTSYHWIICFNIQTSLNVLSTWLRIISSISLLVSLMSILVVNW